MLRYFKISLIIFISLSLPRRGHTSSEVWLHVSPDYKFENYSLRPEVHFKDNLSTGMKTKALKGNLIINQFVIGAAYFDYSIGNNEQRPYLGTSYVQNQWKFREMLETRFHNNQKVEWRLRSKIDFEVNNDIATSIEALYQLGTKDIFELRTGFSISTRIGKNKISFTPTVILTQHSKPRYILMLGDYF